MDFVVSIKNEKKEELKLSDSNNYCLGTELNLIKDRQDLKNCFKKSID